MDEQNLMGFWAGKEGVDPQLQNPYNAAPQRPASSNLGPDGLPYPPQPVDGLSANAPPPFLTKTYDMVDDPSTDHVVSWSRQNNSFVVWNPPEFARDLLPKYFKHNNFSSFVRQLNTYGFRKVDPDRWEFANEGFLRGQKHLLKNIHRRKPSAMGSNSAAQAASTPTPGQVHPGFAAAGPPQGPGIGAVEVGKFGLSDEVERLKRDKNVLMLELVRLRQQQAVTEREVHHMAGRLSATEQRQQQMMAFLAKAVQNPSLLAQLVSQNEKTQRLTGRKKRRLPGRDGGDGDSANQAQSMNSTGSEPEQEQGGAAIVKYHAGQEQPRQIYGQRFNSSPNVSSPQTEVSGSPPVNEMVDPLLVGSPGMVGSGVAGQPEALPLLPGMGQQGAGMGGGDNLPLESAAAQLAAMVQRNNQARPGPPNGTGMGMGRPGNIDSRFGQQAMQHQQQQSPQHQMGMQNGYMNGMPNMSQSLPGLHSGNIGLPPMANGIMSPGGVSSSSLQGGPPASSVGVPPPGLSFPGMNDVFWEQFLGAAGGAPPPGVSGVNLEGLASDNGLEHGDEASSDRSQAERFWAERAQVERLAEQMGQLGGAAQRMVGGRY